MNVHGVYDTSAYMLTFESRSEYRSYIQQEAGVSGSIFGFYAGVKEAYRIFNAAQGECSWAPIDFVLYNSC